MTNVIPFRIPQRIQKRMSLQELNKYTTEALADGVDPLSVICIHGDAATEVVEIAGVEMVTGRYREKGEALSVLLLKTSVDYVDPIPSAGPDDSSNGQTRKLGPFPITERVFDIVASAQLFVGVAMFLLGMIFHEYEIISPLCLWTAAVLLFGGAAFAFVNRMNHAMYLCQTLGFGFISVILAIFQTVRVVGNA
jgi:hypothetical protein